MDEAGLLSRVLAQAAPVRAAAPAPSQAEYAAAEAAAWRAPGILGSTRVTTSFGHVPAQLVRVTLIGGLSLFPEIRGHKNRFSIRFLSSGKVERPVQCRDDVAFTLTCCVF